MNSIPLHATGIAADDIIIEVLHAGGRCERRKIGAGDALLVGSASSCSLRLEAPDVSPLHCWLRFEDGRLSIQDWNSEQGVYVDGARVDGFAYLAPEQVLRIGETRIRIAGPDVASSEDVSTATEQALEELIDSESAGCSGRDEGPKETAGADCSDGVSASAEPPIQLAVDDRPGVEEDFEAACETQEEDSAPARAKMAALAAGVDPFDQELIEMLRAEVVHLESELADRDARLSEMSAQDGSTGPSDFDDEEDSLEGQAGLLLDRLESLLEELSENDRRVRTLEELLQSAEEVAEAEREERRQIESWINDIEERIAQREDEWQAELDVFRSQIQQTAAERDRAEQMLARGQTADHAAQMQQELVQDLRRQVAQLEETLSVSEKAREELQKRLDVIDVEDSERMYRERVEEMLREERLQLAEERTELAQARAELTRVKAEISEREKPTQQMPDEATTQIYALRQHLQEIHEQEKQDREQRRLSRRIARLWRRFEG